ncbi:MAG: 30S ribosome-binding factor RbfA [Clostridiales bacterium]|nr:30S ribosome-binding factor RbfA [Clostridiales bacterium]
MRRNRAQIVGDEMQKVLSNIIQNDVKDPRIPLLTSIVEVKMSSDLTHATCYVSVFGDDKAKDDALSAIIHATGFIRREMCKHINLRVAPELHFVLDNTIEEAAKLYELIDKTIDEDEKRKSKEE